MIVTAITVTNERCSFLVLPPPRLSLGDIIPKMLFHTQGIRVPLIKSYIIERLENTISHFRQPIYAFCLQTKRQSRFYLAWRQF